MDARAEFGAVSAVLGKVLVRINDTRVACPRFDSCPGPVRAVHLLERGHDIGHILVRQVLVIGHPAKALIHRFEVRQRHGTIGIAWSNRAMTAWFSS